MSEALFDVIGTTSTRLSELSKKLDDGMESLREQYRRLSDRDIAGNKVRPDIVEKVDSLDCALVMFRNEQNKRNDVILERINDVAERLEKNDKPVTDTDGHVVGEKQMGYPTSVLVNVINRVDDRVIKLEQRVKALEEDTERNSWYCKHCGNP